MNELKRVYEYWTRRNGVTIIGTDGTIPLVASSLEEAATRITQSIDNYEIGDQLIIACTEHPKSRDEFILGNGVVTHVEKWV